MKADRPAQSFIRGTYTDLYTDNIFGSYFTLSLDMGRYKEKIRRYYEEQLAATQPRKAETLQKNREADSKILAYASGDVGLQAQRRPLARLQKEKAEYARFLEDFYKTRWPAFSADALLFVGSIALEEKNYPLALDCLAVADANSAGSGLDPEVLNSLKTKGALAILEAASFLRDNSEKMDIEVLSQHLNRERPAPLPGALSPRTFWAEFRLSEGDIYDKNTRRETDLARKDYYKESLDYRRRRERPGEGRHA